MLQHLGTQSVQGSLDSFFTAMGGHDQAMRAVSKSALCQARRKLKASAFEALNQLWVQRWHASESFERWHGLRVVAADGTCLRLPRWRETQAAYGQGPCGDGSVVMARCNALLSVATGQFLDVRMGRYDQGERELLMQSIDALQQDDVLVLDRGYPSWWLFAALQARSVHYCVRIDACSWPDVDRLLRSSAQEMVVQREARADVRKVLAELGLPCAQQLHLRLVKVRLPSGRMEVLATSLLDCDRYPAAAFCALYGQRWAIEEAFKTIKHRLHVEAWSGELPHAIEQEVAAKTLMHNIAQALCAQATALMGAPMAQRYRVNHAYALTHVPRVVVAWIAADLLTLCNALHEVVSLIARTRDKIRPGRSFARKHTIGGAQRPRKGYR